MKFEPHTGYYYIKILTEEDDSKKEFMWNKNPGELSAARILGASSSNNDPFIVGKTAVVLTSMIQEFEFSKQKFLILPEQAVVGFLYE
jgi:hypothetical protein